MSAGNHVQRPSRTYKNGQAKPVIAKRLDHITGTYDWDVVFPQRNNFGSFGAVMPEAELCGKAEMWCLHMNAQASTARYRAVMAERAARRAANGAAGQS